MRNTRLRRYFKIYEDNPRTIYETLNSLLDPKSVFVPNEALLNKLKTEFKFKCDNLHEYI